MQRSIAANEPVRMRSGRKALQGCKKAAGKSKCAGAGVSLPFLFFSSGGSPAGRRGTGRDGRRMGKVVLKKYQKTEENPLLFSKKTCIL